MWITFCYLTVHSAVAAYEAQPGENGQTDQKDPGTVS